MYMTDREQRAAAKLFAKTWNGKGKEDEDSRSYWIQILSNILGVENPTDRMSFEKKVIGADGNTKRIDVYIPETQVLIEQKTLGISLDKPQASHDGKTPYEQAEAYNNRLPKSEKARWIVTSNFSEIWIYDMELMPPKAVKLNLTELEQKYHMLDFLIDRQAERIAQEKQLSLDAGKLVGKIYDALLKQYPDPDDPKTLKKLNRLLIQSDSYS